MGGCRATLAARVSRSHLGVVLSVVVPLLDHAHAAALLAAQPLEELVVDRHDLRKVKPRVLLAPPRTRARACPPAFMYGLSSFMRSGAPRTLIRAVLIAV